MLKTVNELALIDKPNDHIAPNPGFTDPQYVRLALVYIIASARLGKWLIPGFHCVIYKQAKKGFHDDPQNFDLEKWSMYVGKLIEEIKGQ